MKAGLFVDGVYGLKSQEALEKMYAEVKNNKNFSPYVVKVIANALNIRQEPNKTSQITGVIKDKGCYTIVAQEGTWGKLKSGIGWISLNYTKKIK